MVQLETDRLILREWQESDRKAFARINGDPMVMEYLPRVLDQKSSDRLVDRFQAHFKKYGYGLYVLERREDKAFMGFAGLNNVDFEAPFTPAVEIAWRLDYPFWGHGYATEAAQKVIEHAFETLKLPEIVSFTVHDNARAIHVMEKQGMVRDQKGDFDYPALRKGHPLGRFVLYRLKRKAFLSHKKAAA
jgi:RimJ/RimL family protein N-acetyltransferase